MQSAATIHKNTRPATTYIWFVVTQAYAVLGAWASFAGSGAVRGFALVTAGLTMLVPLLVNLQWGLTAMVVFEPLRGFLRRLQYLIVPYSDTEPIHLLTPVVTLVAFMIIFKRFSLHMFFGGALAKAVTLLGAICFLQIFNPLQGGVVIGLSGALFYLVPMAWFYLARAVDEEFFPKTLKLVAVMGAVCSLWGLNQIVFGYSDYERYWIENTDAYSSIAVYNVTRALATFSSAEEWGRYVLLGALAAFGFSAARNIGQRRYLWLGLGLVLCFMLALSGQRTSIFGLILGLGVLFGTGARTLGGMIARMGLLALPFVLVVAMAGSLADDDVASLGADEGIQTMLSHAGKGTIDPTGEGSLAARFRTWGQLWRETIPSNPLGSGLGARSALARRSNGTEEIAIDNHFFYIAISAGVPAMLLLIGILFGAGKAAVSNWLATEPGSEEDIHSRIALALLSSFILNNFFGTSFAMYSIAPIGWLLIGWIARRREGASDE